MKNLLHLTWNLALVLKYAIIAIFCLSWAERANKFKWNPLISSTIYIIIAGAAALGLSLLLLLLLKFLKSHVVLLHSINSFYCHKYRGIKMEKSIFFWYFSSLRNSHCHILLRPLIAIVFFRFLPSFKVYSALLLHARLALFHIYYRFLFSPLLFEFLQLIWRGEPYGKNMTLKPPPLFPTKICKRFWPPPHIASTS